MTARPTVLTITLYFTTGVLQNQDYNPSLIPWSTIVLIHHPLVSVLNQLR